MTQQAPSNVNPKQNTANYRARRISFLPLSIGFLAFVTAQFLVATPAKAAEGCNYEGAHYDVGQTRGPYVCMPDGTWQPR